MRLYPMRRIDDDIDIWYERDYTVIGLYSIDGFFTRRNLIALSILKRKIETAASSRSYLLFAFTAIIQIASRMSSFRFDSRNPQNTAGGILKGALYIPSLSKEARITELYSRKVRGLARLAKNNYRDGQILLGVQSTTTLSAIGNSVDYVFLDPPFGSNIIYSDLSLPWETWLRVETATAEEAVVHRKKRNNPTTEKMYGHLMLRSLRVAFSMLRPGHWISIEFSNTKASI